MRLINAASGNFSTRARREPSTVDPRVRVQKTWRASTGPQRECAKNVVVRRKSWKRKPVRVSDSGATGPTCSDCTDPTVALASSKQ
eukprot:6330318-Pyramimonas_sp.AAC.1